MQLELFQLNKPQLSPSSYSLEEERIKEEKYLFVLGKNNKAIAITTQGKKDALSIARQLDLWIQTLSDQEKSYLLVFMRLSAIIEHFRYYVVMKYEKQRKKQQEWREKLSDANYVKDVERLIVPKIYEYKAQYMTFLSTRALFYYHQTEQLKRVHAFSREVSQQIVTTLRQQEQSELILIEIKGIVEEVLHNSLVLPTEALLGRGDV
ncbi:hypothetical protein CH76_01950 [Lysinibacillus sp. BF-4]|uniref:hypothetical protein n=1 Tax=Lysinibacillus sp. BF-4 TaxID=1473546 RepID=UPI000506F122|nr:hypothetical protein [Lysinibacillus sp. BF-4]KFL44587.1 hypothetical protein CH76_01950 [Lysinibacillus sp. BF-4]